MTIVGSGHNSVVDDNQASAPFSGTSVLDFYWGRVLGRGAFGNVLHAVFKPNGMHYAVKIVSKHYVKKRNVVQQVTRERNILSRFSHELIVKLRFAFQDSESLYFVLDLQTGGTLQQMIESSHDADPGKDDSSRGLTDESNRFVGAQIAVALGFLHGEGVIHRDLKPSNVLISCDGHIRLTDFGTALDASAVKDEQAADAADNYVGTADYVSPEVLRNELPSRAVDYWALGCIMYQMRTLQAPFCAGSEYLTLVRINQYYIESWSLRFPDMFTPELADLIRRLLAPHPEDRLGAGPPESGASFRALQAHPFFRGQTWDELLLSHSPLAVAEASFVLDEPLRDGVVQDLSLESEAESLQLVMAASG